MTTEENKEWKRRLENENDEDAEKKSKKVKTNKTKRVELFERKNLDQLWLPGGIYAVAGPKGSGKSLILDVLHILNKERFASTIVASEVTRPEYAALRCVDEVKTNVVEYYRQLNIEIPNNACVTFSTPLPDLLRISTQNYTFRKNTCSRIYAVCRILEFSPSLRGNLDVLFLTHDTNNLDVYKIYKCVNRGETLETFVKWVNKYTKDGGAIIINKLDPEETLPTFISGSTIRAIITQHRHRIENLPSICKNALSNYLPAVIIQLVNAYDIFWKMGD